jgi:hypothetical protein
MCFDIPRRIAYLLHYEPRDQESSLQLWEMVNEK